MRTMQTSTCCPRWVEGGTPPAGVAWREVSDGGQVQHFQRFKDDAMRDMDREDGSHDRPCDANDEACVRVRDATREAYRRIREHKQRHVDHMASTFNRVNDDYQNALSKIEETKKKLQEAGCPQEGGDL